MARKAVTRKVKHKACKEFDNREGLTDKQKRFLNSFATKANATQAAWDAGVSRILVYTSWRKQELFEECFQEAWQWHLDKCRSVMVEFGEISPDYAERVLNRWEPQDGVSRQGGETSIIIQSDEKVIRITTESEKKIEAK